MNGISLLNLSYIESLKILQSTGKVVELIVSQIFQPASSPIPPPLPPTSPPPQPLHLRASQFSMVPLRPLSPLPSNSTANTTIPTTVPTLPTTTTTTTNDILDSSNKCISTANEMHGKYVEIEYGNNDNINVCKTNTLLVRHQKQNYQKPLHEWISSSPDIKLQLNADEHLEQRQQQQHIIHFNGKQTEITNRHKECKNVVDVVGWDGDSYAEHHRKSGDISLLSARSMPDLPKVCIYTVCLCMVLVQHIIIIVLFLVEIRESKNRV